MAGKMEFDGMGTVTEWRREVERAGSKLFVWHHEGKVWVSNTYWLVDYDRLARPTTGTVHPLHTVLAVVAGVEGEHRWEGKQWVRYEPVFEKDRQLLSLIDPPSMDTRESFSGMSVVREHRYSIVDLIGGDDRYGIVRPQRRMLEWASGPGEVRNSSPVWLRRGGCHFCMTADGVMVGATMSSVL